MTTDSLLSSQKLQLLGRMAADLVHDFNNLLAIMDGYGRLLEKHLSGQPALLDKVQAMLLATQRGMDLTTQIRMLERTEQAPGPCDLTALVRENRVLLKPVLGSRIELALHVPDRPAPVPCPADHVIQAMLMLAMSARRRQADRVCVSVTTGRDRAFLNLRDNSAVAIESDAASLDDLQRVRAWMAEAGGLTDVFTHPGHSNEVTVVLPLLAPRRDNPLLGKTVLVVDDEEALLPVLEDQLQGLGLKVLKAANADTALWLRQTHDDIDFLLTDIVMPGMDGVQLADTLSRQSSSMGVIYMTGYPRRRDTLSRDQSDALVISKPLRQDALSDALQKALERVQAFQEPDSFA